MLNRSANTLAVSLRNSPRSSAIMPSGVKGQGSYGQPKGDKLTPRYDKLGLYVVLGEMKKITVFGSIFSSFATDRLRDGQGKSTEKNILSFVVCTTMMLITLWFAKNIHFSVIRRQQACCWNY